jgi:hypothetical protein
VEREVGWLVWMIWVGGVALFVVVVVVVDGRLVEVRVWWY